MRWGRAYFAVQAFFGSIWWIAVFTSTTVRNATLGGLDPLPIAALDIPLFVIASALAAAKVKPAAWTATGWTGGVAMGLVVYATITTEAGWGVLAMAAATAGSVAALVLLHRGRLPTEWLLVGPFAFRTARATRRSASYVASSLGQMLLFWGFFLGLVPAIIVVLEQRWQLEMPIPAGVRVFGAVLFLLASALGVWSALAMAIAGKGIPLPVAMPNQLVVSGPFRFVRNPMAIAGIVQGVAVGLMFGSWLVVAYAVAGSLVWNYAIRPHEEANLVERFGESYRRYRDAVRCWIPRRAYRDERSA